MLQEAIDFLFGFIFLLSCTQVRSYSTHVSDSLTHELVEDWMNWPKYVDYAEYVEYAESAKYAEYAEYTEYAEYAE